MSKNDFGRKRVVIETVIPEINGGGNTLYGWFPGAGGC